MRRCAGSPFFFRWAFPPPKQHFFPRWKFFLPPQPQAARTMGRVAKITKRPPQVCRRDPFLAFCFFALQFPFFKRVFGQRLALNGLSEFLVFFRDVLFLSEVREARPNLFFMRRPSRHSSMRKREIPEFPFFPRMSLPSYSLKTHSL